jgi:hypothetical protein
MRVINYANSLNFFDKGKNIEIYAAAAFYMTLRFIKVNRYINKSLATISVGRF